MSAEFLSAEARLLFLTAGGDGNAEAIRTLARGSIAWDRLCALTDSEHAASVVWRRIAAAAGSGVDATGALARLAMVTDFRMALLERRLGETLDALRRAGVAAMLLKGAALASAVYRSFGERPMGDIDLLVRPADAERATAALLGAGWVWHPLTSDESAYGEHHHLRPMYDAGASRKNLELHTELLSDGHPFALTAAEVWDRARAVRVGPRDVIVPSAAHLLLHACVHFAWSHELQSGAWRTIRDVAELTRGWGVHDWEAFVDAARRARAGTCCYWTLRLARVLSGLRVPDHVMAALAPRVPEFVRRRLEHHYAANVLENERACPSLQLMQRLWELGIEPGRSGHGGARPWLGGNDVTLPDEALALDLPTRARRHLRLMGRWARYAERLALIV